MKRDVFRKLFPVIVFVALGLFILNPAFAGSDCYVGKAGVWDGDYEISSAADLEGLSGYTSVTGNLSIQSVPFTSLDGLECLTRVDRNLEIFSNYSITSLAGLESLKYVRGNLEISSNYSLTSVAGLESLKYVRGNLRITENDSLTSVAGLQSLEYVRGYLEISYADLTSLAGLESLKSIGGNMIIEYNLNLTSLSGLENLKYIRGYMSINDNYSLCTSLAETFSDQVFVGGSAQISYNNDC